MPPTATKDDVKDALREAITDVVENDDGTFSVDPEGEDEVISGAEALIEEVRGEDDATVNVYRIGAGRGKEAFLFSQSPNDVSAKDIMERCQTEFLGGDFKMVIRDANRIVRSARFSVEIPKQPDAPPKPEGLGITELLAMMQAQNTQNMQMFQASMTAMAEAFKGSQNNQPAFNPTEATRTIMESVAAIKQLADPPAPPPDNGSKMVEMLIQGVTLAREIGGKEGETNTNDLLSKAMDFLPALATGAQTLQNQRAQPPVPVGPQPHPDPETQASIEREHREAMEREQEKQAWELNIAMLLGWAKQGKDPLLYAELILDNAGEEKVIAFIEQPDAMEKLISINPEVANFRPWFEQLKAEILALTEPDPAPDTPLNGEATTVDETPDDAISETGSTRDASSTPGGSAGS